MSRNLAFGNLSKLYGEIFKFRSSRDETTLPKSSPFRLSFSTIRNIRVKEVEIQGPNHQDYLQIGDIVESLFVPDGWFKGKITNIRKRRNSVSYGIAFDDGDFQYRTGNLVRLFESFVVGEIVRVMEAYESGVIIHIHAIGQIVVKLDNGEELIAYPEELKRLN